MKQALLHSMLAVGHAKAELPPYMSAAEVHI